MHLFLEKQDEKFDDLISAAMGLINSLKLETELYHHTKMADLNRLLIDITDTCKHQVHQTFQHIDSKWLSSTEEMLVAVESYKKEHRQKRDLLCHGSDEEMAEDLYADWQKLWRSN